MSKMNVQNEHICQKLAEAQEAVSALINQGLTVVHIGIEGPAPRIQLMRGPKREGAFPISWKAIRPSKRGPGREIEMAACVNGCEVRWMEQE